MTKIGAENLKKETKIMGPGMFDGLVPGLLILGGICGAILAASIIGIIWLCASYVHISFG